MGTNFGIYDFAELVKKRPGSGMIFSLCENGVEYTLERSKNFGIIIGIPNDCRQAIVIPDYKDLETAELASEISSFLLYTALRNGEEFKEDSKINVIALTN